MKRTNISSTSPLEDQIGFSRAVRVGNHIFVSGTAPISEDGTTAAPSDVYGQMKKNLEISQAAIQKAGGDMKDVVRTRIMLRDISKWQDAAKAHGEFFSQIKPTCTFIEVSQFISRTGW